MDQRAQRQTERLRGLGLVAVVLVERTQDEVDLVLAEVILVVGG